MTVNDIMSEPTGDKAGAGLERSMASPNMPKEDRTLAAAADVFTRYGYARTTMGDIARLAGISRPSLYLLFSDKDAVFARVIRRLDDLKHIQIETELRRLDGLEEKLLRACLDWGLHGVELAAAHPDAVDLFDLRFPAVQEVYARFEMLVAGLIAQAVAASSIKATPGELARSLVYGMRGLRATVTNVDDMRRLVTVQVMVLVQAISVPST